MYLFCYFLNFKKKKTSKRRLYLKCERYSRSQRWLDDKESKTIFHNDDYNSDSDSDSDFYYDFDSNFNWPLIANKIISQPSKWSKYPHTSTTQYWHNIKSTCSSLCPLLWTLHNIKSGNLARMPMGPSPLGLLPILFIIFSSYIFLH